MPEFGPQPFGDTPPPPRKDSTQALLISLWLRKRVGIPDHLVTTEKVGTVMEAYGILAAVLEWYLAAKKKQREEVAKANGSAASDAPSQQ